jgi:hypothetical protein
MVPAAANPPRSMAAMRARPLAAATLLLLAAACGGEPSANGSPTEPASTASTAVTSPSREAEPSPSLTSSTAIPGPVDLPADARRTFDVGVNAENLALQDLVPPGAAVGTSWTGTVSTAGADTSVVVVSWSRGDAEAPEVGLEIWQQSDPTAAGPWRVGYAFTDPAGAGVFGVRFDLGDLTADGSPDVLSFEDIGGSGACGTWRVIEMSVDSYAERYRKQTCDTTVRIVDGDLRARTAVFAPDDAHCCPSAFRTTTLRWNGSAWDVVDRTREPASA